MKGEGAEEHLVEDSNADDQNPSLPRDVFPNRFRYSLTRHKTLDTAMGLELAGCGLAIFFASQTKDETVAFAAITITFVIGALVFGATLAYITDRGYNLSRANTIQFMKEIATIRPGIDASEWDTIAARMNPILYESDSLATPYFFYDGESCYSFFKYTYLDPYLRRKNPDSVNAGPVDELQPLIDQVLKAYEERINEDWQRVLNEAAVVGNHAMDV